MLSKIGARIMMRAYNLQHACRIRLLFRRLRIQIVKDRLG
jgi:hypothetical protein